MKPKIICLCGSTKFRSEFVKVNYELTLAGNIVLAPGVFGHSGDVVTEEQKQQLDELHLRKIDLADSIFVINPNGYIGEGCKREIEYAKQFGKPVFYLVEVMQ